MNYIDEALHYLNKSELELIQNEINNHTFNKKHLFYQIKQIGNNVVFEIAFITDTNRIIDIVVGINSFTKASSYLDKNTSITFKQNKMNAKLSLYLSNNFNLSYEVIGEKKVKMLNDFYSSLENAIRNPK